MGKTINKIVRVDKGIITLLWDGTILNFPNGNDQTYQNWLETEEANQIWMLISDKEGMVSHEAERSEAYDILEDIMEQIDIDNIGIDQKLLDRYYALFTNPKSADYGKNLVESWIESNEKEMEKARLEKSNQITLDVEE